MAKTAITPTRAEDFAAWYQAAVSGADLAEMAHVRGCMVIKPWGLGIWEAIKAQLNEMITDRGVENVYFPLFIPLSYIAKEAEHVAGFAKEMAVVTHHRLEERDGQLVPAAPLAEPVVVRPTSETVIAESMRNWIDSYRDLPMLLNQWANVVRWEMRPRVFLRTTEFLWQEGHTAHETAESALEDTHAMHRVYTELVRDWLAIPVIPGEKPASERFPGAENTYTIEAMMQDGKAVQAGTSHFLGQNFAKSADIQFSSRDGAREFAYTTSWGVSTRLVGALIMVHGDDDGIRVPPRVAPQHVVISPIVRGEDGAEVIDACRKIAATIDGTTFGPGVRVRAKVDARDKRGADKKWDWIKKGIPLIIEIGPRDLESGEVMVIHRDDINDKVKVPIGDLASWIPVELDRIQAALLAQATANLEAGITYDVTDVAGLEAHFAQPNAGFVIAPWCDSTTCEDVIGKWSVTVRCIPHERGGEPGPCVVCGEPGESVVLGRSY